MNWRIVVMAMVVAVFVTAPRVVGWLMENPLWR